MEREAKLKQIIQEKYGNLSRFAEASGVPYTTINNIFKRGLDGVGVGTVVKLCTLLGVDVESLIQGELAPRASVMGQALPAGCQPVRFVHKPRLGAIACGQPILAVEETDTFDQVPQHIECDFTLLCRGDSMINARIFDGDIVYIRSQPEVENGEIAAVRIGDEATLKKVYYTPGSDRITLQACNPLYPDLVYQGDTLEDIEILGKAVAFTSTLL